MINLENNFIDNNKFRYIEKVIFDHNFKYSINYQSNVLHFYHIFIHDYKIISTYCNILESINKKINKKIINAVLVLVPKTSKKEIIFKENLNLLKDTTTSFYLLNKNNGQIKFINVEPIETLQNQMLTFKTNLKPKIYSSTDSYKSFIQLEYD